MRIGIIHRSDVADVCCLSGYSHFMAKALGEHVGEVVFLGPDESFLTRMIETVGRILNRVLFYISGSRISPSHHRILAKRLAQTFAPRIRESGCDVIFAPNASVEIASLSTDVPIIYSSDLTWANVVDYYPGCTDLLQFASEEGARIEASAIKKSSALIYPSAWAMGAAVEHYGANPSQVYRVPWGANFAKEEVPSREAALHHPLTGELRLLWIGVDWERKGGPIAYDCLKELLSSGTDARLVVCGCIPPAQYRHPKLEVIPFLSKRVPAERRKLSQLFLDANFFLFPTLAEAYGIVLCEASAHGLPSLVRSTGGVAGAVADGKNGYLLAPDAKGAQYAEKIMEIVRDHSKYGELVQSSRGAYEEELNWDAWGRAVKPILEKVAQEPCA